MTNRVTVSYRKRWWDPRRYYAFMGYESEVGNLVAYLRSLGYLPRVREEREK